MYRPEDHIQQLADYFKRNINKGYTLDSLRFSLLNQGYSRISVNKALELANQQLAVKAPIIKEKPQIVYRTIPETCEEEKDFFLIKWIRKIFSRL
jgi:hypothetical protein